MVFGLTYRPPGTCNEILFWQVQELHSAVGHPVGKPVLDPGPNIDNGLDSIGPVLEITNILSGLKSLDLTCQLVFWPK
jgi:hypothetical protein